MLKISFHWKLRWGSKEREKDVRTYAPSESSAQLGAHLESEDLLGPPSSKERTRELPQGLGPDSDGFGHLVVPSPCTDASRGFP